MWQTATVRGHAALLYSSPKALVREACQAASQALRTGRHVLFILEPVRCHDVRAHLEQEGIEEGVTMLDVDEALARMQRSGRLDTRQAHHQFQQLMDLLADGSDGLPLVVGQVAGSLWAAGRWHDALALERLWHRFAQREPIQVVCPYPVACLQGDPHATSLVMSCHTHLHHTALEDAMDAGSPAGRPPRPLAALRGV